VRRVLSRLKKTLVPRYYTDISKIGEADHIIEIDESKFIEIDESKFGKRKYNRGHAVEGIWVLGMVDRVTRKIYLCQVAKKRYRDLTGGDSVACSRG